ncbi:MULTISPECIES: hypothetical protein [unclassified Bradyrhizobium]|uniref:hypothetical protein n=1 Tax=unclassified Bradyrhizobium TaxID=2631580 RepID=UPI001BAE3692|nr:MULTISPECIES: hypothetical protein [unclassified Bradyrhizobium]MBR1204073.1 hypothetical protein [Bradyrhizobium sp. AUGA SZCCT0124]MBR1310041.1 hypothetical protein [Bradyrhizobium sp. AUGA SZCCT0051]MBR1340182.1 hypothetical protein [Bradyrhizobium sp. AUGA SZCCT0105]MBR1354789.1 hypothetical protein [Bradyrhizobium sp. AUGA SZCCT0045]
MTGIDSGARGSTAVPLRPLVCGAFIAILAAFGLYAAFISGPAMRAAAHDDVVRMVAEEDRRFCKMFGLGTDTFAACSRELSTVGQRQVDRDNAAAQGLL